ncbi:hypothetical protein CAPTEDRAFT_135146 [Capitella teleta]|uniref:tRNA (uracil(54)-C(5))-methyltransferase n=1 Tax=Capitella teleta TaxID=283909 RepID=R7TNY6_CAPTE|nr:hypothetical protein CAPTEDRAFT_135146 [Capitella teleta]|eukprot:ELT95334.1 hypothetical protein CAPTEDRAFT_135146 [Capitella teleta]
MEAEVKDEGEDEEKKSDAGEAVNPYSYLERDEFTTEIFKIEINHPKQYGTAQLKKRLQSLDLKPSKVKVITRERLSFVTFRCEEDREKALEVLQGHKWMGKNMKVKRARAAADPMLRKRKHEAGELNDAVTPWWNITYQDQLKKKNADMKEYIRKLGKIIEHNNPLMKKKLIEIRYNNDGLCCQLDEVVASPIEKGYRNKAEFTIGKSVDGIDKTVGFRLGQYRSGNLCVVEPEKCLNIPPQTIQTAKMIQDYLRLQSEYCALDPESKVGHWMTATVRTNSQNEVTAMLQFHPQALSQDELLAEEEKLRSFFLSPVGKETQEQLKIISFFLLFQSDRHDGAKPSLSSRFLFHEQLTVHDTLTFRVSLDAFFQVNTPAAERLYSQVAELCGGGASSTVLDVCCGTGTIGLSIAKQVEQVVGIEMCPDAVKDAKHNAEINGITNAEFHCGKAEELLPWMIRRYGNKEVVAVVDPPRAGLHNSVVLAIRKSAFVKRLVYVSCKPTAALNNLTDFTRAQSNRVKGQPFTVTKAVPVDLFPLTPYCELILLLER